MPTTPTPPTGTRPTRSLFSLLAEKDFRRLFTGKAASMVGTEVGHLAIPLLALSQLDASPGQVGLLAALATAAFLLIGLPAGVWVDAMRRRTVLIAADLVRALVLASIPVAWALGVLTIEQLYVCVLLNGMATVFFDVGAQSYLPFIVGRDDLVRANALVVGVDAVGSIGGRGVGGFLVQYLGGPLVVLVNSVCYFWSALWIALIRRREPAPQPRSGVGLLPQIREGVRFVFGHRLLRPIAFSATAMNFSIQFVLIMMPVMVINELGMGEGVVGLFFAAGGVGILLGSLTAERVAAVLGHGRSLWISSAVTAPFVVLVPLVDEGVLLWAACGGWLVAAYRLGVHNVVQVSFRQHVTPGPLLGRMNATMRFLFTGVLALGAAASGALAEVTDVRTALWVGAVGIAVSWLPMYFSPLRGMRHLPEPDPHPGHPNRS
ncbi:putative MFS family arabinose efflux permease [Nocardiopsis mwathae]|uniref:Putative MFS family arabinose efflux permease n=1 Tax=Nocardiopsis mwathae TaxID=1472723 RepID=A0A7X0D3W1_9ACTN|nr:MFS transporter [Nocardiopsis mwathae]MBB6170613.1 putative MFS family arabinose efflux permease [Nocardiopsis mwathae]